MQIGEYVLATKYDDGDPCDHFVVGFISGYSGGRWMVVDGQNRPFRANGFRRVEKITHDEGTKLCEMMSTIGDRVGKSVWEHLAVIRGKENMVEQNEDDEREQRELNEICIGNSVDLAMSLLKSNLFGYFLRIISIDDQPCIVTRDYCRKRVNVTVKNGIINSINSIG